MARRSNKLVWLIGIPVIAFGLAKGGMHWYVKQKLDRAILEQAPKATIKYGELETSLQGRVNVTDISIVPVGQEEAFRISQVSVQGPDVLTYLMDHNPVSGRKGPPEYLDINIRNFNLDLTGDLAANLDQSYRRTLVDQGKSVPVDCLGSGGVSLSMLQGMGQQALQADARMSYRYNEKTQKLKADFDLQMRDIQSVSTELALANVSPQAIRTGSVGIPSLSDFRVTVKIQPAFGKNMSAYCAVQLGTTTALYEERSAAMFLQNLADNGIVLGRGLQLAVRSYYTNWGEIDVIAKPLRPLNLLGLVFRPPKNFEEALGLQVTINDHLLTDLNFKLQKGARFFSTQPEKKKEPLAPKVRYKMVWSNVAPASLRQHLYKDVKLHMTDAPMRLGILVGVEGNTLLVQQRKDGGKFTAHVPLRNIVRAEVRQRVVIKPKPESAPPKSNTEKADTEQAQATT